MNKWSHVSLCLMQEDVPFTSNFSYEHFTKIAVHVSKHVSNVADS